jgi:hypothetical protein
MPGMGGTGAGGAQQNTPPGVLPPPGLESGGVRTLMGTTITPPDDSYLLVRYGGGAPVTEATPWKSCRRVSFGEGFIMLEGLNYDGRDDKAAKDTNQIVPLAAAAGFEWKYEARPAPPAQPAQPANGKGAKSEAKPTPKGK